MSFLRLAATQSIPHLITETGEISGSLQGHGQDRGWDDFNMYRTLSPPGNSECTLNKQKVRRSWSNRY